MTNLSPTTQSASSRVPGRWDIWLRLVIALAAGATIGAGVAVLSPGPFLNAWLPAWLLSSISVYLLAQAWNWAGRGRALAWMVALAFLLRMVVGIGMSLAMPIWGYPEKEQQAGYLFKDAYARDMQAWDLASSRHPLWTSFRDEFATDQYGGLLAVSAAIYRYISPDAHRSYLLLIVGAFFAALGAPFLLQAVRLRWPERVGIIATWIYVLYPDAIFFGSGQMREPFLVGLAAIAFWLVLSWDQHSRAKWAGLIATLFGMALISSRVAGAMIAFLAFLFLMEYVVGRLDERRRVIGRAGLVLALLLFVVFSWEWFRSATVWDVIVTQNDSGWVAKIIHEATVKTGIAAEYLGPVLTTIYGLARPVLPAAITQDAQSTLWKVVGIVRSIGWYMLAPFLVYGLFAIWREQDPARRRRLIWLAATVFIWLVIASARGGGDAVDNPRYRSLLMPFLALLAAWAIDWALAHRDAWLWRWIAIEGIFMTFFTIWYASRYWKIWGRMSFWATVGWIVILSGMVLVGGWAWDNMQSKKPAENGRGKVV